MEKENVSFIGRHQIALEAGKLLLPNHEYAKSDIQEATGKDITERAQILKKAEQITEDIRSGDLKHVHGALDISQRVRELIQEGYENCVLSFDPELEKNLIQIFDSAAEIVVASSDGKISKEQIDKTLHLARATEGMLYPSLGGLVATGKEEGMTKMPTIQKAWFIYSLLNYPNKLQLTFMLGDKEELVDYGQEIRKISAEMLGNGTISAEEFGIVNDNFQTLLSMVKN